uniref:Uncharacterized protein n=1 Tax=Peronospora matthiolae TaxID=2874970 RepID=A0AAV1VBG8_9STRA
MAAANEDGPELMIHKNNQSCIKMTKNPVNHGGWPVIITSIVAGHKIDAHTAFLRM